METAHGCSTALKPDPPSVKTLFRLFGLCGICGASLLLGGDWLMLGTLTSGWEFNANWLIILAEMPSWRVIAGAALGPYGACLYVMGFCQLFIALKSGGWFWAFVCAAGFAISLICIAASAHTAFPFAANLQANRHSLPGHEELDHSYQKAMVYFGILFCLGIPPALISSLILPLLILNRPTHYPRWFAIVNPTMLWLLTMLFAFVPAPLGGLLVIGSGNIVFILFFSASTIILWQSPDSPPEFEPPA